MDLLRDPELLRVWVGVFAVLAAATSTGTALRRLAPTERARALFNEIDIRIWSWWAMSIAYVGALVLGPMGMACLFAVLSFLALGEFMTLVGTHRADHSLLCVCFFVIVPLQYVFVAWHWYTAFVITIPVCAALAIPAMGAMAGDTRDFTMRMGQIGWGLLLCAYCISHAPALLMLDIPGYAGQNAKLLLFLIVVVESSDVLQYIWGKAAGRRPVAPAVSPSKTVEGLLGGVLSASVLGAALSWMTPFGPLAAGVVSFTITTAGFGGGLIASAVKRDRGVKDFGTLLPGHGGALDRLDSLAFAAPIFFHVTRYFAAS
jgi:phosphatidate cytidylyltransferase